MDAILLAWHERQVSAHLRYLVGVRDDAGESALERLEAVLEAYAMISHRHDRTDLTAFLHRGAHMAAARGQLHEFIRDLIDDGVAAGQVRDDVAPDELASYCEHALAAAAGVPSSAAVHRLVNVILAGLQR